MFNLPPIYPARKSSNYKLFINQKFCPDTNLHKTYTNSEHKMFQELVPSVSPLFKKKTRKARTRWYRGSFHQFINTRFLKSIKKEWTEAVKKIKPLYECITTNTSAIWQHAAQSTYQNSLLQTNCIAWLKSSDLLLLPIAGWCWRIAPLPLLQNHQNHPSGQSWKTKVCIIIKL